MPSPAIIIVQEESLKEHFRTKTLIFRLGWLSFILGACAFTIHYISIDRLGNYSPINAGIISGFFFMVAGLASVGAAYRQTSGPSFKHARLWSFIVNIVCAPGLMAVSIAALVLDSQDVNPLCQASFSSSSQAILFGYGLEVYPSNVPCIQATNLLDITQILNAIQLIIGSVTFFVHMILLSMQRKVLQQIKVDQVNTVNEKLAVQPQAILLDIGKQRPNERRSSPRSSVRVARQLNSCSCVTNVLFEQVIPFLRSPNEENHVRDEFHRPAEYRSLTSIDLHLDQSLSLSDPPPKYEELLPMPYSVQ